ncbi:MAG: response regulator [Rhodosalinus sp.]
MTAPPRRRDIADELREAGYRVREAADAAEAVAALRDCTPDLVLCDIMMPIPPGSRAPGRCRRKARMRRERPSRLQTSFRRMPISLHAWRPQAPWTRSSSSADSGKMKPCRRSPSWMEIPFGP